jgi:protein subunit release factor B
MCIIRHALFSVNGSWHSRNGDTSMTFATTKAIRTLQSTNISTWLSRAYFPTTVQLEKALPPRRKITDDEIEESFLKGSGPGGQKINKTSSAVQLKHLPTGIVVKSQETRSREQNRKLARQVLGEKLDAIEKGEQSRTAIKTERARVKKASANKKTKRKYRKLAEGREGGVDEETGDALVAAASGNAVSPGSLGEGNGPEQTVK